MTYKVLLTDDAARDLEYLYSYITKHDSPDKAEYVLGKIEELFKNLTTFPERGSYPCELLDLGIKEYREIYFKFYRIIYRIIGDDVYVYMICDGRRDMQTLLQHRLLGI